MGILTIFVGTASALLLFGIAYLLRKHAQIAGNRTAVEIIDLIAMAFALFAGVEFAIAGAGAVVAGWIRGLLGLLPVSADFATVIIFLVTLSMVIAVVRAFMRKGKVGLGKTFFVPVLLASFAAGTIPAMLFGLLTAPAAIVTTAIASHI